MVMPQPFTITSPIIASYTWEDFSNGSGVVVFYGARVSVDGTPANDNFILSREQIVSAGDTTSPVTSMDGGGATQIITFSTTFGKARIADGNLYLHLPVESSGPGTPYYTINIYHYDGITQTEIATSKVTRQINNCALEIIEKFPLTRTNFAVGESLQIKLTLTEGAATNTCLYHDPSSGQAQFTQSGGALKVYVPFLIQE